MDKDNSPDAAELRRRAEERLAKARRSAPPADQDLQRLVSELQVHQAELELQNEELQQARDQVEAGLRRYTDLYDFAPVGYLTVDAGGVVRQANLAASGLVGVERSRLIGRRFAAFLANEHRATFSQFLGKALGNYSRQSCGAALESHDGRRTEIHLEGLCEEGSDSCRVVLLDISDRKLAEALLLARDGEEQAKLAAEHANAAKDHFLAALSHELRTPLTPVLTAVSMLQKQTGWDRATRDRLEVVRRNVELEARLIDDLLDITRITRGKMDLDVRPMDLCSVIHLALEVCRPDIEARGLEVGLDLEPASCTIHGDTARLEQVFWNLLRNAIKFTPQGGCVGVRSRVENDQAVVEVSDSGRGIEPEFTSRIFQAFEQTAGTSGHRFGGLGLGLSICKGLAEMHGGTIEAHSEGLGKGATFTVRLPLGQAAAAGTSNVGQPGASAAAAHPPSGREGGHGSEPMGASDQAPSCPGPSTPAGRTQLRPCLRLLVVEDHLDTAEMLECLLTAEGHQVTRTADVASALRAVSESPFDLLISDLGLPDRSGIDLMRELRARGNTLPGIALSGYGRDSDVQQSMQAGFAAHVLKPVDTDRLLAVLADVAGARSGAPREKSAQRVG